MNDETSGIFYITFGQGHTHKKAHQTFDKDIVGIIKAKTIFDAAEIAHEHFGRKYVRLDANKPKMEYYPRGMAEVN